MLQGNPLSIKQCSRPLSNAQIRTLPQSVFNRDWEGAALDFDASFALLSTVEHLYFAVSVAKSLCFDAELQAGSYVPGLWQADVAEIFLADADSGTYQEFNLSPSGAWWSMFFCGYREAQEGFAAPAGVQSFAELKGDSWLGVLTIPLADLKLGLHDARLRVNVTMILGREARRHLSWAAMPLPQPDFHRSEYFLPVHFDA